MKSARRAAFLGLLPLLAAIAGAYAGTDALKAGVFDPPRAAPDFTLSATDGGELHLGRYRGKVIVLAFGYSACTEVCPLTLAVLARARTLLGTDGRELQVVYITVDPEHDTAAHLKAWLTAFDPSFVGGTGTPAQLAAVRALYGISAQRHDLPHGDYSYTHSSFTLLIDKQGALRALMPFGHSAEDYAHDVRLLARASP
jgi:protein SCO1